MIFLKKFQCQDVEFNTCAYQMKLRTRWFKPAKFAGKLDGLPSLKRTCTCPSGFKHEALIGKDKTAQAAEYPEELALEYGKLVIKAFRAALNLEWWRSQEKMKRGELNDAQKRWVIAKEKTSVPRALEDDDMRTMRSFARSYDIDSVRDSHLPGQAQVSKKRRREDENEFFIGGMRNPASALARMAILSEAGQDVARLWRDFVRRHPEALQAARTYGSERCEIDEVIHGEWDSRFKKLIKADIGVTLKAKPGPFEFTSPLKPSVWRAWERFSKDPEKCISVWAEQGVPLGMGKEIPRSDNIFPPTDEDTNKPVEPPGLEQQLGVKNYTSMLENEEAAEEEIERLIKKNFVTKISKQEVLEHFSEGTLSRLALISKQKESGWKHRIITDLLRSGGNGRSVVPERIVLPRIQDVVRGIQKLWDRQTLEMLQQEEWGMELVGFDLADAYCHFGVHPAEVKNCISPSTKPDEYLVFKAAPLIMGRLSASMARQWQSFFKPHQGSLQVYMDDPLLAVAGTKQERDELVALCLHAAKSFGINLSYHKGERGTRLTWIGVTIELDLERKQIVLTVPQKLVDETKKKLEEWSGMVSLRDLRAVAGKLSWLAGVLVRSRWAVSILYSVIADVENDIKMGLEKERAAKRSDKGEKPALVPVKRMELPRAWFIRLLQCDEQWRTRRIDFVPPAPNALLTDASPWGIGLILAKVEDDFKKITPFVVAKGKVTQQIADALGLEFGNSSSQSALEAWAILLGIRYWASTLRGTAVLIRADSTAALHLSRKLSSSSPVLNWVGAEIALRMEALQLRDFVLRHVHGKLNNLADWLSRAGDAAPMPEGLKDFTVRELTPAWMMESEFLPPGKQGHLWGKYASEAGILAALA